MSALQAKYFGGGRRKRRARRARPRKVDVKVLEKNPSTGRLRLVEEIKSRSS